MLVMEEDEKMYGEILKGITQKMKLSEKEVADIHKYVVWKCVPTLQVCLFF